MHDAITSRAHAGARPADLTVGPFFVTFQPLNSLGWQTEDGAPGASCGARFGILPDAERYADELASDSGLASRFGAPIVARIEDADGKLLGYAFPRTTWAKSTSTGAR